MDTFSLNDLEHKRESNKIGLQHFFLDLDNRFEQPANKVISELRETIAQLITSAKEFERIRVEEPERWAELQQTASHSDINLDWQVTDHYRDASYYEEELLAFAEMKIIYAYKHFEININRLLKAAFSLDQPKGFYQWDAITAFLKSRNIITSQVKHHQELKELQGVNNMIKHSDRIDSQAKSIREFAGQQHLSGEILLQFYERVRDVPLRFIEDLSSKIYDELYKFDQHKLQQMTEDLALRLGKQDAMTFIELLSSKY